MKTYCPSCQTKLSTETKDKWFPFCCERCKLIDLGSWLNEDYRINSNEPPSFDNNNENSKKH